MSQSDMEFGTPPLNSNLNTQEMIKLMEQTSSQLFLDAGLFVDYIHKLGSQEKITPPSTCNQSTQEIIDLIQDMSVDAKKSQNKNLSNQSPISNFSNNNKNYFDINCDLTKKRHIEKYLDTYIPNYVNGLLFQPLETRNYYPRYSEPAYYGEVNRNNKRVRSSSLSSCKSSLQPDFSELEQDNSTTSDIDENNNGCTRSMNTDDNSICSNESSLNESKFKDCDCNSNENKNRRSKNKDRNSFLQDRKERNRIAAQKLRDKRRLEKEANQYELKVLEDKKRKLHLEVEFLETEISKYRHLIDNH